MDIAQAHQVAGAEALDDHDDDVLLAAIAAFHADDAVASASSANHLLEELLLNRSWRTLNTSLSAISGFSRRPSTARP